MCYQEIVVKNCCYVLSTAKKCAWCLLSLRTYINLFLSSDSILYEKIVFLDKKTIQNICWGGGIVPRSHKFMSVAKQICCEIENPALAGVDTFLLCWGGEIGRHVRFRCVCRKTWGFESPPQHFFVKND